MSSVNSTLIEGVGDDVLALLAFCFVTLLLTVIWYSTYLTPNQRRLPTVRIQRRDITVNRVPDSSSTEARAASSASNSTENSSHQTDPAAAAPNQAQNAFNDQNSASESPASSNPSQRLDSSGPLASGNENTQEIQDSIRIRLRFLSEEERVVLASRSDTILAFKRKNFATELSENKVVKLIYNGQVLTDDRVLESLNITDNTVIHAIVSPGVSSTTTGSRPSYEHVQFNAGALMLPLFGIILALLWYLRFQYGQYFNVTSTISLICLTTVSICFLAQNRSPSNAEMRRTQQYGVRLNSNLST